MNNPYGIPLIWWLGFACQYQDGRRGNEGRVCSVLTEIKFGCPGLSNRLPINWNTNKALSQWEGIEMDDNYSLSLHLRICKIMFYQNQLVN